MTFEEWRTRAYRVQLTGEDGNHWWVMIEAAIGPFDAKSQAKYRYPDATPLRAQPYLCESCGHPANDHDLNSGQCSVAWSSAKKSVTCSCQSGYVAGKTAERLYPGQSNGEEVIAFIDEVAG